MTDLRALLEEVSEAPPPRKGFHDELWERIYASGRDAARRRRRVIAVLAATTIAAATATAVVALVRGGSTVDATYSCATGELGGEFQVRPAVNVGLHESAGDVWSGAQMLLEYSSWTQRPNQFTVDGAHCQKTSKPVPLAASGLPPARYVVTQKCTVTHIKGHASTICDGGRTVNSTYVCIVGEQVLIRFRIAFNASGKPTRSAIAIRGAATGKPIAYFSGTPPYRLKAFVARACRPH